MKKFSALIAAALIALSLTVPVYAEPDESSSSVSSEQSVESVTEDSSNPSGDESSSELSSESVEEESVSSSDTSDTSDSQSGSDASTENSSSSSEESSTEPSEESSEPSEKMEESSSDGEKSEEQSEQVSVEELDPSALTYQNYQLDGVNMTISLPDSMYVLTREMAKDDPTLTACKLTKEEVTESFKATDTYIKASAKDFSYDITVQLVKNENTKAINDLTSLEDDELQDVIDNLLKQNIYTGCSKTKFNDTLFLTLDTQYDSSSTNIVGIQEYTIVQGTKVVITFQSYNNEVSPQQKKLLNTIMNSVIFEKTQPEEQPSVVSTKEELDINRLDVRYIYLMAASVIALIFLTSIIVVGLNYRKSKSNSDEKVKEKESIKTDDRQVDPKTSSDTEKKVESEIANTLTIKSVDTYNHDEVKESLSAKIGDIKQKNNMPPQKTDLKEASAPLETKTDEKSATRDENSISSQKSEVKTEQADTKQIPKLEETEQGKVPVSLTKPEKNQSRELEEKNSAVQDEPPIPSENNTDDTTNDDTVFDDVTVVKKPVNPSFEMEGIIFAGGMPSGNVDIEQIQETLDDKETAAAKAEPEKELSAYERRFGKNRTASSYAQSMENTGSNDYSSLAGHSDNISKFEKRFGKLKPVSNENIDFKTDLKKKNELGQNKLQEISKSAEPEKADSLETETPEPEKADSLETETTEPEKADSLETETPEPEKADSLETETPEPEKADSLETETPEPEKAETPETETTEPEKADSLETETPEPEKAETPETATEEPAKTDQLEEKMDSRLSVDEITADAPNHKSQTEEEKTMDQKSNEKIGFFAKLKSKLFTAEDDTEFDDIDDDIVYESDNGEGNNLWEKVKNKLKNHPVPEEDSDDLGDDSVIIKPIEKNIEEEKRPENEIYTAEENVVPSNDIELEIGKSEDGKIVIGASAQNAAQQLDTTVKDGSKLLRAADKSAKKPSTDELDQFNENVIYEASDEENTLTYENTPEVDPEWEGKKAVHAEAAIKAAVQALEPRKISGSDEDFFDGVGGEKNAAPQKNDRSAQKRSDEKLKESFRSQTEVRSVEPTETQLRSEPVRSVQPSVGSKPVPSVSPQPKQKTVKPKFIFERDSGIVFEHASAAQQLIEPVDTPFTVIPRLESVNADEYNHRMEELKKSLAKEKKANSGRLGVASANENPYGTTSRYEKRFGNAQPAPDPAQKTPSPLVAKPMPPKTEVKSQQTPVKKKEPPKNTVSNNDATGFYQRYDPTADPFANETYKTEEMLLNEQKKNTENEKSEPNENKSEQAREKAAAAASAVGSMIKRSLKSLLSSEEDDGED